MALTQEETERIIRFVKGEPRTVQAVAQMLGRSWATADSYVQQVRNNTGSIDIKVFREGTRGAVKVVYYNYAESLSGDDVQEELYRQIRNGRVKQDFDFFEVFQFVPEEKKKALTEPYDPESHSYKKKTLIPLLRQAESVVYVFSGNMSFLNTTEANEKVVDVIRELVERKVRIKVLCRVNIASLNNISNLNALLKRYPEFLEIRHSYQPLRGFIIDDAVARFKNEEMLQNYKKGELRKDLRIFYEIYDTEWISWIQKVFWRIYRSSIDHSSRVEQFRKVF